MRKFRLFWLKKLRIESPTRNFRVTNFRVTQMVNMVASTAVIMIVSMVESMVTSMVVSKVGRMVASNHCVSPVILMISSQEKPCRRM